MCCANATNIHRHTSLLFPSTGPNVGRKYLITELEPDILKCEVKWTLENTANNKAAGDDEIPAELFKILYDNAIKGLQEISR